MLVKNRMSRDPITVSPETSLHEALAIMHERHGTEESLGHHVDSHGMSIWLPFRTQEYRESYELTAFALDTNWDEFLRAVIRL